MSSLYNFARRKVYQFEVTFTSYMLTSTEKIIFNTLIFLFLGFLTAAITLYLPQHVQTIARRAYFYVVGDESVIRKEDMLDYST
ncbi:hypothetical protein H072_5485 [Dactylellina haptotyla CBS 200.50]|uniref:Uncharacterized protein n=1 Tax=Dactylellina haptotyla (strain CBS 200.50) TaxID=1284197 RepID=S8BZ50_DACHA|nr:hypothetical protein H072_5485 [Dactylellina haptotyla CBS 200.50]